MNQEQSLLYPPLKTRRCSMVDRNETINQQLIEESAKKLGFS